MSATEILVIILSSMLALFLLLGIVLVILLIRISRQIQAVTSVAKSTVDNLQHFSANISKFVAPATLLKFATNFIKKTKQRHK